MSANRQAAIEYVRQHRERFLAQAREFLAIPSVSTEPAHKEDVRRAAEWVAQRLRDLGARDVTIYPTEGHPVVYGLLPATRPDAPTILVYGHYDVQPPDPLDLWESPPFEATVRGENLYARGAADMKGQIVAVLAAVEALARTGDFPVHLKFLIEGEEEIGSPHLPPFLEAHRDLLACDVSLNADSGILGADLPSITYALRGLAAFELRVYGPARDLHSGVFGGIVHNAANALAELIAGMHDRDGRITLPGFYDRVRPLDDEEREELARLPMDESFWLEQTGAPALYGEPEFTPVERATVRPTLDVNGIIAGFTGKGVKTVIPSQAVAKITCRLAPDQDPDEVHEQLRRYLEENAPPTIRWELDYLAGAYPAITDRHSRWMEALVDAMERVWGKRPLFKREGATVPIVGFMQRILGVDSVMAGFILPDANLHAPNEKLHLPTWYRGIETYVHYLCNLG